MQVTLVQSEIEQALKNYINDIMTVKDGMSVTITLRATRGEEGTTAVIDILPAGQVPAPVPAPAPAATPAVRRAAQAPVRKVEPAPVHTPQAAVPIAAPETTEDPSTPPVPETPVGAEAGTVPAASDAGDTTGSDAGDAPFTPDTTDGTLTEEVQATEKAPVPAADKPKSLFANLRKPVNN